MDLSSLTGQDEWGRSWEEHTEEKGTDFLHVSFGNGDLLRWYTQLSNLVRLPLCDKPRVPPAFTDEAIWQLKNIKKCREPPNVLKDIATN